MLLFARHKIFNEDSNNACTSYLRQGYMCIYSDTIILKYLYKSYSFIHQVICNKKFAILKINKLAVIVNKIPIFINFRATSFGFPLKDFIFDF